MARFSLETSASCVIPRYYYVFSRNIFDTKWNQPSIDVRQPTMRCNKIISPNQPLTIMKIITSGPPWEFPFKSFQTSKGAKSPFSSRPWLISRHHHRLDPLSHWVPMQLLSNESDIALDIEEAVLVDRACEEKLGVSWQICGAGRCITRGWRAEIIHKMIQCFKTGEKAYLTHCPEEGFHVPMC